MTEVDNRTIIRDIYGFKHYEVIQLDNQIYDKLIECSTRT